MASEEEKADEAAAKNIEEEYSNNSIHMAAFFGNLPALRHFLRVAPERVDEKSSRYGTTPLHQAAFMGQVEAAELLLSKGAALDAKTNDGRTPLDRARDGRKTKMEQFLLNRPAKKPSAEDGKTPRDLSSKGKSENEPLSTAADKTSEAQQTRVFPFSSPRRQTSKEDAAPHAAGSGAVAVKHQREASKEEAKKPSAGDGKVPVADKASEEVKKAAQELKKAMESANVKALKEAIDKAKLHKVSQEEVMEAMDKYIALRESADPDAPLKPLQAAPSEADQAVRLDSGRGARLAMFSARFNAKNKDTEMKFRAVHKLLLENQYEVLMVDAGAGKSFGEMTLDYLYRLQQEKGVMLAVCTSDYGEMTDSPYSTYHELKLAKEYNVDVLPLQVEDNWKPNPPCGEGHLDHSKSALRFIHAVFIPSIVRIDCRNKAVEEIAREIAAALRKPA